MHIIFFSVQSLSYCGLVDGFLRNHSVFTHDAFTMLIEYNKKTVITSANTHCSATWWLKYKLNER